MIKEEDFPEALVATRQAIDRTEDANMRSTLNMLLNGILAVLEAPTWDKYGRAFADIAARLDRSRLDHVAPRAIVQVYRTDDQVVQVIDTRTIGTDSIEKRVVFNNLPYKISCQFSGQPSNRAAAVCLPAIVQEHVCNPIDTVTKDWNDELGILAQRKAESGALVFEKV